MGKTWIKDTTPTGSEMTDGSQAVGMEASPGWTRWEEFKTAFFRNVKLKAHLM